MPTKAAIGKHSRGRVGQSQKSCHCCFHKQLEFRTKRTACSLFGTCWGHLHPEVSLTLETSHWNRHTLPSFWKQKARHSLGPAVEIFRPSRPFSQIAFSDNSLANGFGNIVIITARLFVKYELGEERSSRCFVVVMIIHKIIICIIA